MSTTPVSPDQAEQSTEPTVTLAELARTVALADAVEKGVKDTVIDTRAEVLKRMLELRASTGVKQLDVLLDPDDPSSKVATIGLTGGDADVRITDPDAYTAWVEQHYPTEVEYKIVVRESFQKVHLKGLVVEDDMVIDEKQRKIDESTGDLIASGVVGGVRAIPAHDPTGMRLTFARETAKQAAGRQRALAFVTGHGGLAAIAGQTPTVIDAAGE